MEKNSTTERIVKPAPATFTTYYCFKGKEDYIDREGISLAKDRDGEFIEKGYPCQFEENEHTLAKCSGQRHLIKTDHFGELVNPQGVYYKKAKEDKWISVNPKAFAQYINFLRTGNNLFYNQALREMR